MNAITPELTPALDLTQTLAQEIAKTFADLIWVCQSLCELLEIENDALIRHDAKTVRELTENKSALGRLYAKTLASLGSDSDIKANLNKDDLVTLLNLGQRLNQLMDKNALMLKAEIEARKRVMDVFVTAARDQNQNTISYSKKGHFDALPISREHAALAFNSTL